MSLKPQMARIRYALFFSVLFGICFCFGVSTVYAEDKIPKPGDFAGAITLDGEGGSLLKIELPEAVFRGLRKPDLGDIRVFDSEGMMVPCMVRPVPGAVEVPPPQEIPFFAWQEETGRSLPAVADIELDAAGAVLRIKTQDTARQRNAQVYLLDLSGLEYAPAALNLEIDSAGFFNAAVMLFSGKNLNDWEEFGKRQIIAWYGDSGVSRTTVEIPAAGRYLLLRFDRHDIQLRRITAIFTETRLPSPLRETVLSGEAAATRRAVDYSAGGFFPLVSVNWTLDETNSLDVSVKSKMAENGEWLAAGSLTLYRLRSGSGEFFHNKPLAVFSPAPFWRIEAAGESALPPDIACTLRWTACELVFLGGGKGPWTLAYGSAEWGHPAAGGLKPDEYPAQAGVAISPARIIGGPRYTEIPIRAEKPWGQWLLWAVLILAVITLLALAFITAKSMSKENNKHE